MGKKTTAAIVAVAVLVLIGVLLWNKGSEPGNDHPVPVPPTSQESALAEKSQDNADKEAAAVHEGDENPAGEEQSSEGDVVARDDSVPADPASPADRGAEILQALQTSFESGGAVSRIRLQEALKQHWQQNPPSEQDLTELIGDEAAPADFRVYIAKVFRNEVKRRKFDADATNEAFASLRWFVADLIRNCFLGGFR
jgi:hypothetical protein